MGFSSSQCTHQYVDLLVPQTLSCVTGTISSLESFGIIPGDIAIDQTSNSGSNAFAYAFCGMSVTSAVPGVTGCSSSVYIF